MHQRESTLPMTLEGVCFASQGRTLLGPIDLTLERGGCTMIMGPNGAGKSLLLRLCHGLIAPTAGRIQCGGHGSPIQPAVRRRQALVFQSPLMLRRSVLANVRYPLHLQGLGGEPARIRAVEALERVGLAALAQRPARVLSGGEQQRLALARAWVLAPEILLLDEPTSALDPQATQAIEATIREFESVGTKILMTTHNPGQAQRLADECLFMADGRLVERAPVETFLAAPASAEARAFLAGVQASPGLSPARAAGRAQ